MTIFGLSFLSLIFLAQVVSATPTPPRNQPVAVPSAKKTGVPASQAKPKPITPQQKYRVRQGDNLYSIAHAYGMTLGEIKSLNGITDTRLRPGQTLLVKGSGVKRKSPARTTRTKSRELPVALPSLGELAEIDETIAGAEGIEPIARSYLSIPYRYGAENRRSTDCSGFTQQVFRELDISLPRTAREQYSFGAKVESRELQSGDLLFFRTRSKKKYPTHVGIYLGNGLMIHASPTNRKVVIADANSPYFTKRFLGAKRIAKFLPGEVDLETLTRHVGELDNLLLPPAVSPAEDLTSHGTASLGSEVQIMSDNRAHEEEAATHDDELDMELGSEPEPDPIVIPEHRGLYEGTEGFTAIATLTDITQPEIDPQTEHQEPSPEK